MNRRDLLWNLLGLASVMVLPACDSSVTGRSFEPIRYRLTAVVDTPQGIKSGHSVLEFRGSMAGSAFGAMAGSGFSVRGEAVAVDVAPGQVMFVVLRTPTDQDFAANVLNAIEIPEEEAPPPNDRAAQMAQTQRMYDRIRANRNVYPIWRPRAERQDDEPWQGVYFVHFRDINDPKTVELADPDDLTKTFGPGFKLHAFTMQITDEPVTSDIEKRLRWLPRQHGSLVRYPSLTPIAEIPVAHRLTEGDFWQGQS